jgi:ABC-type nitrate/sulfonate/bicarbonate transport system substrate-binding protein
MKAAIFTAAVCVALLTVGGPAEAQQKWRHGILQSKADAGFIYMAKAKGYFAKRGLDVEFVNLRGDRDVTRALLAGELQTGEPSPGGPFQAIEGGADIRFIGSSIPGLPYALYVRKEINDWADLKGKTFGVSSPGSTPDLVARTMLVRKGVDPNSIKIANAGGSAGRVQAVSGGKVDATASSSEFVPIIGRLGIKVMGLAADIVPEYPRFTIITREQTIKQNREALINFLAAYMEGLDYAIHHRDETIKLAAKMDDDKDPGDPVFSHMFEEATQKHYVSTTSEIPRKGMDWLQDEMLKIGELKQRLDLDKYIDGSLREEALRRVKLADR